MAVIKSVHQMAEEVAQEALTNILVCGQPLGVWIKVLAKYLEEHPEIMEEYLNACDDT